MDMGTCCAYFCTGVSFFGILTLAAISLVLKGDGAHYISEEFAARHGEPAVFDKEASLHACLGAMVIYAVFLVVCGFRVYSMNSKGAAKQQMIDDE